MKPQKDKAHFYHLKFLKRLFALCDILFLFLLLSSLYQEFATLRGPIIGDRISLPNFGVCVQMDFYPNPSGIT
jgi:hypothetical protein